MYTIINTITECVKSDRIRINERSLLSFSKNFTLCDRAIINLDIYDSDRLGATKDLFHKYFKDIDFILNYEPNFSKAIKSVWSHPDIKKYDVVFHLEPDWLLNMRFKPIIVSKILMQNRNISGLNFRAYRYINEILCLSPCIIKANKVTEIAEKIKEDSNPEHQIHRMGVISRHYPVAYNVLKDIGREWISKEDMQRTEQKKFIKWEKNENV